MPNYKFKKGDIVVAKLGETKYNDRRSASGKFLVYVVRGDIKEGTILKIVDLDDDTYWVDCYLYKDCVLYKDEVREATKDEEDKYYLLRYKEV